MFATGTPEGLQNISRDTLIEARDTWHVPSNTVVIATGKIDHEMIVAQLTKSFPINNAVVPILSWEDESEKEIVTHESHIEKSDRKQAIMKVGFKIPRIKDMTLRELVLLSSMNNMMGEGFESLLMRELRVKRGLVYGTGTSISGSPRIGNVFRASASMLFERLEEAKKVMLDTLFHVPFTQEHFDRICEYELDANLVRLENTTSWANFLEGEIIGIGKDVSTITKDLAQEEEIIKTITLEEVNTMREKYIRPERMALVALTPTEKRS
jgi:zinc protease